MPKKSELLRQLGWDDRLIEHFMIDDTESVDFHENELSVEVFDSRSVTVNFTAETVN